MNTPRNIADLVGRILMSVIFLVLGFQQVTDYAATRAFMELHGVLGAFLPVVIVLELVGSVAIAAGYKTRAFAFLLASFTVLTALLFHSALGDPNQAASFMKNLAMAGGFLVILAHGAGEWSIDAYLERPGQPDAQLRGG